MLSDQEYEQYKHLRFGWDKIKLFTLDVNAYWDLLITKVREQMNPRDLFTIGRKLYSWENTSGDFTGKDYLKDHAKGLMLPFDRKGFEKDTDFWKRYQKTEESLSKFRGGPLGKNTVIYRD